MNENERKQIKEMLEKINFELDKLAIYLEIEKIDYKPIIKNLEMKTSDDIHRELKLELEIIERID